MRFTALLLTSALVLSGSIASAGAYNPRVGHRHPDFVLPRIGDGQAVSLSQLRGKKVLLIQFASW